MYAPAQKYPFRLERISNDGRPLTSHLVNVRRWGLLAQRRETVPFSTAMTDLLAGSPTVSRRSRRPSEGDGDENR